MNPSITFDDFLKRNRVSQEIWKKGALDWDCMRAIAADHDAQGEHLRDAAELFARVIQRFPAVHSVRWRVKDTEHLLEKIVRKRAEGNEKYKDLTDKNYFEIVTDLVGLRALHLFKDDCFIIDSDLRSIWVPAEQPAAYVREGDPQDLTNRFHESGFEVKEHPAGYRSVHYVCATQPLQRKVFAEIQVRTIFEEGWSEIDHRVRYPHISHDQLVGYFLTIFNRLAGSADEMGTFVQGLTRALQASDSRISEANKQKEEALSAMDKMLADLEALKKQDVDMNKKLTALQQEVAKLRKLPSLNVIFGEDQPNALAALASMDSKKFFADIATTSALSEALKFTSGSEALTKALEASSTQNALARILKNKT